MSIIAAKPIRTLHLDFVADDRKKLVRENLSAVATSGDQLWFGTDEGTLLDCLTEAAGPCCAAGRCCSNSRSRSLRPS